ncbi:MAG: hypothetical protein IPH23_11545 [Gammaproteobacteria bacterium]|nr:hypothetical protein [Gammaproteobacteria bacterium]MBK8133775.1 hypothetical protein [Gammaproteobacteria bacterium]
MAMVRRTAFLCLTFLVGTSLPSCALWRPAPVAAPEVHLDGMRVLDRPGRGPRYRLALRIVNPSDHELAIAALSCRLKIGGVPVVESFAGPLHTLPPESALRVEVEAPTNAIDRLKLSGRLAGRAPPDYELEVRLRRPWTLMPLVLIDAGTLPREN